MIAKEGVCLLQAEIVQLHDLGSGPQRGRQNRTSLLLACNLRDDPAFVLAVHAPPIRMRQEMGAGLQKDFNGPSTGNKLGLMWNFDQKSRHTTKPPYLRICLA